MLIYLLINVFPIFLVNSITFLSFLNQFIIIKYFLRRHYVRWNWYGFASRHPTIWSMTDEDGQEHRFWFSNESYETLSEGILRNWCATMRRGWLVWLTKKFTGEGWGSTVDFSSTDTGNANSRTAWLKIFQIFRSLIILWLIMLECKNLGKFFARVEFLKYPDFLFLN